MENNVSPNTERFPPKSLLTNALNRFKLLFMATSVRTCFEVKHRLRVGGRVSSAATNLEGFTYTPVEEPSPNGHSR